MDRCYLRREEPAGEQKPTSRLGEKAELPGFQGKVELKQAQLSSGGGAEPLSSSSQAPPHLDTAAGSVPLEVVAMAASDIDRAGEMVVMEVQLSGCHSRNQNLQTF